NYAGNQGFNCIFNDSVSASVPQSGLQACNGTPFLFLHDVGCTLGYGWDLLHFDFYPDALDLKQWLQLDVWERLPNCTVQIHGIPGASWMHTQQVRFDLIQVHPLLTGHYRSQSLDGSWQHACSALSPRRKSRTSLPSREWSCSAAI